MRFWRMIAIVIVGIGLGLAWNAASGRGFALSRNAFLLPGDQISEIPAAEARERLERGALVLDARGWEFYKMGHIPGSLNLPMEDFENAFRKLEPKLRGSYDIIVYCAGYGCEASHIVTRQLKEKGVHAVILNEGWPAWEDAGYPTREGEQP
jgi:ArsR family transcriptional regulator